MTQTISTPETPAGDTSLPLTWEGQTFLVGEEIYLRPIEKDDAKWSMSFRNSIFPLSPEITEEWIKDDMPTDGSTQYLGIRRKSDERVVGLAKIRKTPIGGRWLNLFVDPVFGARADRWKLEALGQILPWAVEEQQRPSLVTMVPVDDTALLDGAQERGMRETARFRDFAFRNGAWVDVAVLEYLNPAWVNTLGDPNEIEIPQAGSGVKRPVPAPVMVQGDTPKNAMMIGERVYLRAMTRDDAERFSIWSRREDVSPLNIGRYMDNKLGKWHQMEAQQKKEPPDRIRFAVVDRETDELVGVNGMLDTDYAARHGETESFFLPDFRGRGYGTEAKHLLLDYVFNRLQMHMVVSWVVTHNTRSAAALRKQGYREAGRINWQHSYGGTFGGFAVFDCLADDWRAMPRTETVLRVDAQDETSGAVPATDGHDDTCA